MDSKNYSYACSNSENFHLYSRAYNLWVLKRRTLPGNFEVDLRKNKNIKIERKYCLKQASRVMKVVNLFIVNEIF